MAGYPETLPAANRHGTYPYPAATDIDTLTTATGDIDARLFAVEYIVPRGVTANTTLVLADANKTVDVTSSSAVTVTVPPNSSVAFPIGAVVALARLGTGTVTVVAGAGVTVNPSTFLTLRAQYSAATLRKTATDVWLLAGDIA